MSTRRAFLVTHMHPDQTADAVRAALAAADAAGIELIATGDECKKHGELGSRIACVEHPPEPPELCLALGGDGTILQALRRWAGTGVPVFGINFGTIGFVAAVERDRLDEGLKRAFEGDFETLKLPALVPELEIDIPIAVNDVTFIRKPHGRVAELSYRLGGREIGHVRCDGLVAATPVGSTGYNLANQGPILAWGVEGYVVSFIAPHTFTARPLVVAPGDILNVSNGRDREPVDIVLDGLPVAELESGADLAVSFRDGAACLAQLPGANFYERMNEKFGKLAG
jgi:NAD+ kinase